MPEWPKKQKREDKMNEYAIEVLEEKIKTHENFKYILEKKKDIKILKIVNKEISQLRKAIDILSGKTNMVKGKDESVNALTKLHKLRDSQYE